jgi:hypothetical protein
MTVDRTVLVVDYKGDQALTIICERCAAEAVIDADDILNDDLYACPAGCPGSAGMKYWQADPCVNCGKLGFWSDRLKRCCSRSCMLQAEYAASLAGSRDEDGSGLR